MLNPVAPSTRWILAIATGAALLLLLATAIVFDEKTELGGANRSALADLIGLILGPAVLTAGVGALLLKQRPRHRLLIPVAFAAIVYGAFATWLFFVETTALPILSPW